MLTPDQWVEVCAKGWESRVPIVHAEVREALESYTGAATRLTTTQLTERIFPREAATNPDHDAARVKLIGMIGWWSAPFTANGKKGDELVYLNERRQEVRRGKVVWGRHWIIPPPPMPETLPLPPVPHSSTTAGLPTASANPGRRWLQALMEIKNAGRHLGWDRMSDKEKALHRQAIEVLVHEYGALDEEQLAMNAYIDPDTGEDVQEEQW